MSNVVKIFFYRFMNIGMKFCFMLKLIIYFIIRMKWIDGFALRQRCNFSRLGKFTTKDVIWFLQLVMSLIMLLVHSMSGLYSGFTEIF